MVEALVAVRTEGRGREQAVIPAVAVLRAELPGIDRIADTAACNPGVVVVAALGPVFENAARREAVDVEVDAGLIGAALAVIHAINIVALQLPGAAGTRLQAPALALVGVGRIGGDDMVRGAVRIGRRAGAVDAVLHISLGIHARRVADRELEAGEDRRG